MRVIYPAYIEAQPTQTTCFSCDHLHQLPTAESGSQKPITLSGDTGRVILPITMPHYEWCPTHAQKATPEYRSNTIALWIIFGVSIFVLIWYIAASDEARTKVRRCGVPEIRNVQWFQANLLSGMLVSLLVVSILYTSFPEPIEATFVVVLALSQASALGWLDFPPGAEFWDVFCTKLPDLFALGLTLWAVWDAMERYFEANGNRNAKNAPMVLRNPWIPFAVCSVMNEAAVMVIYRWWLVERKRREGKRISKRSRNLEESCRYWEPYAKTPTQATPPLSIRTSDATSGLAGQYSVLPVLLVPGSA
jgi:hypothetical protein